MNSAGKIAAAVLLFGIAGCQHKVQSAAPPAAPEKVVYSPEDVAKVPLPQPPPPKPGDVKGPGSDVAAQTTTPKPARKKKSQKSKSSDTASATKETAATPAATTQEASAGQPADTSPIGQLTSSSQSSSTPTHQQVQELITNTENGLNAIKRALSSDEQQTVTDIKTFLTKAKKALDQDDLDGANTLAMKAKVLLDELKG